MVKYICEVNKDKKNNELELVHLNKYHVSGSTSENGAIKFKDEHELNRYFKNHCVSEESLREQAKSENNIFMFLFWALLLICVIVIIIQLCNRKVASPKLAQTSFGRFSF